jgi:hypothetical protein
MSDAPSLLLYCYANRGFTKGQVGPLSDPVLVPPEFAFRGTMTIPSAAVAVLWLSASLCSRLLRSIIAPVFCGRPTPTWVHGASLVVVLTVSWTGAVVWLLMAIILSAGCCLVVGAQQDGWEEATGVDLDRRPHVDHRGDAFLHAFVARRV